MPIENKGKSSSFTQFKVSKNFSYLLNKKMSKLFFPLVLTFAFIYFVNTSSNSKSTITSLNTNQHSSRNGNSRSTRTGVSGVAGSDSERSVNQPGLNY